MSEHDGMSNAELHRLAMGRLNDGQRVGRILRELERRGEDTSTYQSHRTTDDLERDLRWGRFTGDDKTTQIKELQNRRR
jgi:hypothetical protein